MSREIEGVLVIDKAAGMTSHDVVGRVRRVAGLRRVGHAGTLDPLATGVLLVCLGRATRLVEYLVGQPKTYVARVRLGQTTDSYDADGVVVDERPLTFTSTDLDNALAQFRGEIEQRPPMFSAVKRQGQPLYKLARQGIEVERPLRPVTIYELSQLPCDLPFLELHVRCSSGTYIRTLAHDLGEMLGCGGHIVALRRTAVGAFSSETAVSLADLTTDNLPIHLLATETAVLHLPPLILPSPEAKRLAQGQRLICQPDQPQTALVRVYAEDGTFMGVAQRQDDIWQPQKILHS
ncbi:MAG: tRNA pseudouridine(55) synthase TruB [Anaerolineales bacterium]|nr:tRNA pseudouridine(55) synthase TruB [Anaerolineales bacterium]